MMPSYAVHAIDDPASDPRPPARCNAFMRKYCRSDNPNLEAAFIYEWTREAMGVHAPPAAAVMQDLARFLLVHPEHRKVVRRVQGLSDCDYSEIQENIVGDGIRPIDMLRCKLSFFGATDFDPRSDRWVRITMFKNAPYPDELSLKTQDNWVYVADPLNR